MRYKVTTAPATEPITLAEAKEHLRILHDDEDAMIELWITASREAVETMTRRALITQTVTAKLDGWPSSLKIPLPLPPLISVSSITYVDSDGATQTLAANQYQVVASGEPAYIVPAYAVTWPTLRSQPDNVTIVFTAGYGAAASVPARAKQAMFLLMSHMNENREAVNIGNIVNEVPLGVKALCGMMNWGTFG